MVGCCATGPGIPRNGVGWRETGDDLPGTPRGDIDRRWREAVAECERLGRTGFVASCQPESIARYRGEVVFPWPSHVI